MVSDLSRCHGSNFTLRMARPTHDTTLCISWTCAVWRTAPLARLCTQNFLPFVQHPDVLLDYTWCWVQFRKCLLERSVQRIKLKMKTVYIYIFTYQYHLLESSKPKHLQKSAATRSITFEIRSHWKTWTIHLNICIASRQPELLTFLWRLVRFYCKSHFAELARRPWTNECVAAWPRMHVESIWLPSGIFALWLGNEHADIVTLRCSVSCRLARCGLIDVLGLTWWTIHEFSKRQVFFEPQCSVRQMQLCLFMPQACSYTVIDFTLVWRGNLS